MKKKEKRFAESYQYKFKERIIAPIHMVYLAQLWTPEFIYIPPEIQKLRKRLLRRMKYVMLHHPTLLNDPVYYKFSPKYNKRIYVLPLIFGEKKLIRLAKKHKINPTDVTQIYKKLARDMKQRNIFLDDTKIKAIISEMDELKSGKYKAYYEATDF